MQIPQIKSTVKCVLIILIGSPIAGVYFAWQTGELHEWKQLPDALTHGGFAAVMLSIGWILFRSPYASKITELLQITPGPKGTAPTMTKLTISEPIPENPTEPTHEGH